MTDKLPRVVVVGRPNVGKSLLFNRLVGRRLSLVQRDPGMTLDTVEASWQGAVLVDTGGVFGEVDEFSPLVLKKMQGACAAATHLLMVVDAQQGMVAGDAELVQWLRERAQKPWTLVINKAEGMDDATAKADFMRLGQARCFVVSAKQGSGLAGLSEFLRAQLPRQTTDGADGASMDAAETTPDFSVAVVGRPNVGKSSLTNRLLKTSRMAVSATAGTTRDAVATTLVRGQQRIQLIDTAGMKRKLVRADQEKLAVVAARQKLKEVECAVLVVDMQQGITHQDKRIATLIQEAGTAMLVVANKADLLPPAERQARRQQILAALHCPFRVGCLAVSTTTVRGFPIAKLFSAIATACRHANRRYATAHLNQALQKAITAHPPVHVGAHRPKLRYMLQTGACPLHFVIHGNSTHKISASYHRYLLNFFGEALGIVGAPIRLTYKKDANPYV